MAEYNPSKIIKDGNTYNFRDTTKIPLSGSNQISGDLIPSTDNSIDIGSNTNNIKMLYTKGITINGTQFLPSDYATLSGLATVATSGSYNDLSDKPTIPTVNNATLTIQQNGTAVDTFTANSSSDKTVNIQCVDLTNNQTVAGNKEFTGTTTAHDLVSSATDTYNLGTSANKWKTLNGINPGALSLPKTESGRYSLTELSSISGIGVDNWVLDGRKIVIAAEYVITGWLYVCIACDTDGYVILQTGNYSYPNCFYKVTGTHIAGYASATIPIVKGIALALYLKGTSLIHARYYPAAGNV